MELLFEKSKIQHYADKYNAEYDNPIELIVPEVKDRARLTLDNLLRLSEWKMQGKRNNPRVERNKDTTIQETTRLVFMAETDEKFKFNRLQSLHGVLLPMASSILHWFDFDDKRRYPIWDWRARKSVQFDHSKYRNLFERWQAYVKFCQNTAEEANVDMRTLDRALWQYHEED